MEEQLEHCLLQHRHRFRRRLRHLRQKGWTDQLAKLEQQIQQSIAQVEQRRQAIPEQIEYPADLPISQKLDEIKALIEQHQVIVLCGETGSGKSTQLPKICLSLGRGLYGRIAHTQPRRIAARSLANRIAKELNTELGDLVGYKVRFQDRVQPQTAIKLLTDGMLLAEIQQDKWLNEYDTIIIDEAHERSLNIDFLIGYLKQLLPKRPELKLIITSATIDPQKFSQHFNGAPIIEVSGRSYPVELRYRPLDEEAEDDPLLQGIAEAVQELSREDRGDILVFLSGEREIREASDYLRQQKLSATEILPLYARLSPAEQNKIFQPGGQRRIVLATNVAETSLTVPGIRHVIDTGLARISRYSYRSKIQRLPIEAISQASADQRKGRCGRMAPGICIRLYSEEDYNARPAYTEPEIQRTNLAAVILQLESFKFGDIYRFPFIDPPDKRLIKDGYRILEEIGAIVPASNKQAYQITRLGKQLARLPIDPRIGRMLLEAGQRHCLREMLIIAAALSIQDPRDRPLDKQQQADEAHALFKDEQSDFISYLNLWHFIQQKRRELSRRQFRQLCRQYFLSFIRIQEWWDIQQQLQAQMLAMGYTLNQEPADYANLHRAILSGLLSHIGLKSEDKSYLGARRAKFYLFPGSNLFESMPRWVVAAELVHTSKLYARTCARIQPEWAADLAAHLVKKSYSEPHWQSRRGQVAAYEKTSLFGLPLIPRKKVNFGPIDPQQAREIFIRSALVEGDFQTKLPFWRHNQRIIQQVNDWAARCRRSDLWVADEVLYQFYDQRIPAGIYSQPQFESWLRQHKQDQPKLLYLRVQDLVPQIPENIEQAFPSHWHWQGMKLPLSYRFEPGHPRDGITLSVPVHLLPQINPARLEWLVPGLLLDKLIALLKSLPKQWRKKLVPIPDTARQMLADLEPGETPLLQAVNQWIQNRYQLFIPESDWRLEQLEPYLSMTIRVIDEQGKTLGMDKDIHALQRRFSDYQAATPALSLNIEPRRANRWAWERLPARIEQQQRGVHYQLFIALVEKQAEVEVQSFTHEAEALRAHRRGLRRLILNHLGIGQAIRRALGNLDQLQLFYSLLPPAPSFYAQDHLSLEKELIALILDEHFLAGQPPIYDRSSFEALLQKKGWQQTLAQVQKLAQNILSLGHQCRKQLKSINQIHWLKSAQDMQAQLDRLLFRGFWLAIPLEQLHHYPRYLRALLKRLDKLQYAAARDQERMAQMQPLHQAWLERWQAAEKKGYLDPRLEQMRWQLEELRVSFFAQELKTAYPVSIQRLEKLWQQLGL